LDEANSSFIVGERNRIHHAEQTSILGTVNVFTLDGLAPEPTSSIISGHHNTVEYSPKHVFVFGSDNKVKEAPRTLILGENNSIQINNDPLFEHGHNMTILVGKQNKVDGSYRNNLLIGSHNTSEGDSVIAIGSRLKPSKESIYIGQKNSWGGGSNARLNNTNHNIVMGQNINFTNTLTGNPGNRGVDSSIFIGNYSDVVLQPQVSGVTLFSAHKTIGIGNNIFPLGADPAGGINYESGHRSISVGNDIYITSANSINIGNSIRSGNLTTSGVISRNNNAINIGNNIVNIKQVLTTSTFLGFGGSTSIELGPIFIGSVDTTHFPRQVTRNTVQTSTSPAQIAFAVAPNMGVDPAYGPLLAPFNLLTMDRFANLFIGLRNPIPGSTLNPVDIASYLVPVAGADTLGGSTVYARQFFAVQGSGGFRTPSDQRIKSNIEALSGNYRDYLNKINPFSYYYTGDSRKKTDWGFMAQDVQLYFPHLVEETNETLSIGYLGFIPILWKINQEQQSEIDQQQQRIKELERQIKFINDFNADELRRQERRINELERKIELLLQK
jgi:hypothetical protein